MKKILTLLCLLCTTRLFAAGDEPMVLVYELESGDTVTIPIHGISLDGSVTINWGDGTDTTVSDTGFYTHSYSITGIDTVKIYGDLTHYGKTATSSDFSLYPILHPQLSAVLSWGNLPLMSLSFAFHNASELVSVPEMLPASVTDVSGMFYGARAFNGDISSWDVSNVTNMSYVFCGSGFQNDLSNWDVSNVTDMSRMFAGRTFFDADGIQAIDGGGFNGNISSWDVSNVTDMSLMFNGACFNGDLSSWDVSNVTDMSFMFAGCLNTDLLTVDGGCFNGDISNWDVSNVVRMSGMFRCAGLFNCDLSEWNVSRVTDMSQMFIYADSFNCDLSEWDVSNCTSMVAMFASASSFNSDLSNWDVSNVTDMYNMFKSTRDFNSDLSNWDVSSVTDMSGMFSQTKAFNRDLSNWDVSNVTNMTEMFSGAKSFNGEVWKGGGKVTKMYGMFSYATSFNRDLSSWDVSKVTDVGFMFSGATSFNGDLSSWDVSQISNMDNMFSYATSFNGDVSGWDVSNAYSMNSMFRGATSFNGDVSQWNVSKVKYVSHMFDGATSFNCDVSGWDVSNIISMVGMFRSASSFNRDLSNWDVSNVGYILTQELFDSTALSISNYDKLLNGWGTHNIDKGRILGASGLFYSSDAVSARTELINNLDWKINGDNFADTSNFVTYDENFIGGVATTTEQFSPFAKYVSPSYFPQREGYKLVGWNSKPDGSGYAFDNTIKITEDITFYAQWKKGTAIIQTDDNPISGADGLIVSPNPVPQSEEKVTLVIPSDLSGNWQIGVYDVLGNELDESTFEAQGGTTYEWDLRNKFGVKVGGGSYVIMAEHTDEFGNVKAFRRTVGVAQ